MKIIRAIDGFFFRRIPAESFGMMRIAWASVAGLYYLFQWKDISYYYSEVGIFPPHLEHMFARDTWRFTLLDYVTQPLAVHCLYLILIILLFCTAAGIRTRISTILSALLMFSFHERNSTILGGGDTLLRSIGFILMIAPGMHALSVERAVAGWNLWKKTRERLSPVTMPIWPWRMLLWQMIVLYATSFWTKMLGSMWEAGTAVQVTLHHPMFARFPAWFMDTVYPAPTYFDRFVLAWQGAWILLLIPAFLTRFIPSFIPRFPLRRILMAIGIPFHLGIFLMMDAGSFSPAMFVAYIGLLREDDIAWLKRIVHSPFSIFNSPVIVLFDGHCGLCLRSTYTLESFDWLNILTLVDFRNVQNRKTFAPDITETTLDKAMHIKLPNGSYKTGFDAFRYMAGKLPPLWPFYPLLWIPGIPTVGRMVYAYIADGRKKCNHENCAI